MRLSAKWESRRRVHDFLPHAEIQSVSMCHGLTEVACLGEGEPLVLLPGLAGGWRLLAPLAVGLARRHRVVMVGLSGDRGLPSGLARSAPLHHAAELAGVLDTLRLERPTIFGVSFGGAVALELALRFPTRVGRLVLMGVEAKYQAGFATSFLRGVLERFPLPRDNAFVNQFFNLLHGCKPQPGPLPDFIVERCWETDQGVISGRLRALESFDVAGELWRLDVPTLVLAGTRDVIVSPETQHELAAAIGGACFKSIADAGHVGFLTHRQIVTSIVARWLRSNVGLRR